MHFQSSKIITKIEKSVHIPENITNEDVVSMIKEGIEPEKNLEILYAKNIRFIVSEADKLIFFADIEELVQEAYFGMLEAIKKWTPDYKFITYLKWTLKNAFRTCIQNEQSRGVSAETLTLITKYNQYIHSGVDNINDADIMKHLDINVNTLKKIRKCIAANEPINIDEPISDNITFADVIEDEHNFEEEMYCLPDDELWNEIASIPDSDMVIEKYKNGKTTKELTKIHNLSRSRVDVLIRKSLNTLKEVKKIQELSLEYGYSCSQVYKYSVNRFKDTGISSTEFIALKHLEMEEKAKNL